jgi:2-polyprenyl-3-methyl-5-hydroxy-6-metoxy-1,4-benzoquinol methylase
MTDDFGPMKETTKAMWSLGDYSLLAKQLEEASRRLVEACAISSGQEVLDVAAGNGNCAIAAARRGAHVVASASRLPWCSSARQGAQPRVWTSSA